MEIRYNTKEESNKIQLENFLKLSKIERLYAFINLCEQINLFPTKSDRKSNNFSIIITE